MFLRGSDLCFRHVRVKSCKQFGPFPGAPGPVLHPFRTRTPQYKAHGFRFFLRGSAHVQRDLAAVSKQATNTLLRWENDENPA